MIDIFKVDKLRPEGEASYLSPISFYPYIYMSKDSNKPEPKRDIFQSRADKLSEIDALYREQVKKIYV